ncbi:helix-turn-helix transcriptional regulator [Microbacterium saperdae]|uniref:AlpA family transcriptional regulator n=1 Tax=Microbacterium saperdae TaxID=69368 RepID=A0A543BJ77_9MICO|nr:hypothetical protein [Microbacterium saperdae]TQL84887.1 hypothetical protein FB560_0480 [Microbacterium saperdae]GGM58622.1 hypothetical protein GCM10010489_32860 [Microbacterium saperdae]
MTVQLAAEHPEAPRAAEQKYLTPAQTCDLIPGMTVGHLAQLRFTGKGPKFLKPTPRTVLYRTADIIAWLENSEQTSTAV